VPADALTMIPGTASAAAPGFYGKLPARGDFLGRRLGRPFIDAWDGWLQEALLASKDALGSTWRETYLTSPIWRFAFAAGSCGPAAVAGLVMPSVDKVGRYFPLMLGGEFPAGLDLTRFVPAAASWYEALEELALAALSDAFDLARFDEPLSLAVPEHAGASPLASETLAPPGRHFAVAEGDVADFCRDHAEELGGKRTLWWTQGSERVSPCVLVSPGLPPPASFPALLDGAWSSHGWPTAGPPAGTPSAAADAEAGDTPAWDREE